MIEKVYNILKRWNSLLFLLASTLVLFLITGCVTSGGIYGTLDRDRDLDDLMEGAVANYIDEYMNESSYGQRILRKPTFKGSKLIPKHHPTPVAPFKEVILMPSDRNGMPTTVNEVEGGLKVLPKHNPTPVTPFKEVISMATCYNDIPNPMPTANEVEQSLNGKRNQHIAVQNWGQDGTHCTMSKKIDAAVLAKKSRNNDEPLGDQSARCLNTQGEVREEHNKSHRELTRAMKAATLVLSKKTPRNDIESTTTINSRCSAAGETLKSTVEQYISPLLERDAQTKESCALNNDNSKTRASRMHLLRYARAKLRKNAKQEESSKQTSNNSEQLRRVEHMTHDARKQQELFAR